MMGSVPGAERDPPKAAVAPKPAKTSSGAGFAEWELKLRPRWQTTERASSEPVRQKQTPCGEFRN